MRLQREPSIFIDGRFCPFVARWNFTPQSRRGSPSRYTANPGIWRSGASNVRIGGPLAILTWRGRLPARLPQQKRHRVRRGIQIDAAAASQSFIVERDRRLGRRSRPLLESYSESFDAVGNMEDVALAVSACSDAAHKAAVAPAVA